MISKITKIVGGGVVGALGLYLIAAHAIKAIGRRRAAETAPMSPPPPEQSAAERRDEALKKLGLLDRLRARR